MIFPVKVAYRVCMCSVLRLCARTNAYSFPKFHGIPKQKTSKVSAIRAQARHRQVHSFVKRNLVRDKAESGAALVIASALVLASNDLFDKRIGNFRHRIGNLCSSDLRSEKKSGQL